MDQFQTLTQVTGAVNGPVLLRRKTACRDCPFRVGSPHGYCDDGHDALAHDAEPSCHEIVGAENQFSDPFPTAANRCVGHDKWHDKKPGYQLPRRLSCEVDQTASIT